MKCFVDRTFLSFCPADDFPADLSLQICESSRDIDFDGVREQEFGVFVTESLDDVLDRMRSKGVASFNMIAAGRPRERIFRLASPWSATMADIQSQLNDEPIHKFTDKTRLLAGLEDDLLSANVRLTYVNATMVAAEECLQNAIFDAHPQLSTGPRDANYELDAPVSFASAIIDGLVVIRVRDPHGRFTIRDFSRSAMARFHSMTEPSGHGMKIGLAMMIRNVNALLINVVLGVSSTVTMITDTTMRFRDFLRHGRMLRFQGRPFLEAS